MGIDTVDLVVIVAAIAVGAFIKGATGGGLPQIAIPVMAVFLGVEHAVVVMAIPGVVANGWLVWSHRAEARHTRDLPAMLAAGVVGAVVGTMLLESLDGRILSGVLAAVIVGYIVIALVHPGFTIPARVTRFASPPVGLAAGGLQGATGISGPLLTTYLHGFGLPPRAYVFALSTLFFVFSTVQAITLAGVGLYTPTRVLESLLALVPILVALPLGSRAARRLSRETFQRVILVLLAASVVSLLHDTFAGGSS
jgi:uncharacterized membrane protein YfcA